MPRKFITEFDVYRAANALYSNNREIPTNDAVFKAMGSRGSMSTLAPYMKQWRLIQQGRSDAELKYNEPIFNALDVLHDELMKKAQNYLDEHSREIDEKVVSINFELAKVIEEFKSEKNKNDKLNIENDANKLMLQDSREFGARQSQEISQLRIVANEMRDRRDSFEAVTIRLKNENEMLKTNYDAVMIELERVRGSFEAMRSKAESIFAELQEAKITIIKLQEGNNLRDNFSDLRGTVEKMISDMQSKPIVKTKKRKS